MPVYQGSRLFRMPHGQDPSVRRVLKAQEPGPGIMVVIRLDQVLNPLEIQASIFFQIKGLGLDTPKRRSAPSLINIGMRLLPDNILITPPAMGKQGTEITLGATGNKKPRLLAKHARSQILQPVYRRIIAEHIVSYLGLCHNAPHLRSRPGHGITSQVDHAHDVESLERRERKHKLHPADRCSGDCLHRRSCLKKDLPIEMSRFLPFLLTLLLGPSTFSQEIQFNRDIRPILSNKCFLCHGPDEKKRKADLRLDLREGAVADLGGYAAIVPGKPEESELLARIAHDDPEEIMPPPKAKRGQLTPSEISLVRRWIEQGAAYQGHWAFQPVAKVAVPDSWQGNPIDYFVEKRLKKAGVLPSAPTDPETLLRRLSLDLTGLLPSLEEQQSFPAAGLEATVDRLMTSPHFGERWARHWLDQARYADSHGYSIDGDRQMWPFRDWVIKALNDDLPFDQFTIEQLAGDLLPNRTKAQHVASAFHRNTLINQEGGSDREQFRVESVIDRVNTTGAVWLGLTVGCAQCHTHKFDPITQREYYQLFAFFNNTEDANSTSATVEVEEYELLDNAPEPPPAKTVRSGKAKWNPVHYQGSVTSSGKPLHVQKDNSLLVDRTAGMNDSYHVRAATYLDRVSALRLRVLPDKSLPRNGPGTAANGNFVLTRLRIQSQGKPIAISHAFADHEQPGYPITGALDQDGTSGWAINVGGNQKAAMNAPHEAVFVFTEPLETKGEPLEITMEHALNESYLVGRFAIELSSTIPPTPAVKAAASPKPRKGRVMVMKELPKPRPTFLFTRGDFTRPDKEAGEIVPDTLSQVSPALVQSPGRPTRLELARWLIHPENPLTPRVTVNRIWMRYFGRGLVETEEDLGTQGSPPSHPDLLDYLSHRFVEEGWSMKKLHRLIVTSKTYQRSSHARPDLAEIDPGNYLLARQNRIRLDAEIVRDAALCASGLLAPKIGGPGVYPPQPPDIYAFTQSRKNWKTSTGADRYRRGMYIFFYRSAPYPLLQTFDAPDFQTTCTRRVNSNTPLQALTVANDPAFLELAQGFAERLLRELPSADITTRIKRAYQLALSRVPSEAEEKLLADYFEAQATDFASDAAAAGKLATDTMKAGPEPYSRSAALVCVARAILNTDNFITRE